MDTALCFGVGSVATRALKNALPDYWRCRAEVARHNARIDPPEVRLQLRRRGNVFSVTDPNSILHIASLRRWPAYRQGIQNRFSQLAAVYGVPDQIPVPSGATELIVDIGANIGEFTLYWSACGFPVISIEPDPLCHEALTYNVANRNVTAFRVALWKSREELVFYSSPEDADSSLIEPEEWINESRVSAVPLDDLSPDFPSGPIHLLKCDAEGAEPEVLMGASETLKRTRHVTIDCSPERQGVGTLDACDLLLRTAGFETWTSPNARNILMGRNTAFAAGANMGEGGKLAS